MPCLDIRADMAYLVVSRFKVGRHRRMLTSEEEVVVLVKERPVESYLIEHTIAHWTALLLSGFVDDQSRGTSFQPWPGQHRCP